MPPTNNPIRLAVALLSTALCAGGPHAAQPAFIAPENPRPASNAPLIERVEQQVVTYLGQLADLHCTEEVKQQKLHPNGKPEDTVHSSFDYFILIQGANDDFQLTESRLEKSSDKAHNTPMLLTNGFSSLLLVFHPYYRNSFDFTIGAPALEDGRTVVPIHFTHIPGTRSPAGLALRDREFALDIAGTAYVEQQTAQILRIDSNLSHAMLDIGLKDLAVQVEYSPFEYRDARVMLPATARIDLETQKQHWRNEHTFKNYRAFTTEAEQSTNVTVHKDPANKNNTDSGDSQTSKKPGGANPPAGKE